MNYRRKKTTVSPLVFGLLGLALVLAALVVAWSRSTYLRSVLDRSGPELLIEEGQETGSGRIFTVTARDSYGIRSVVVSYTQADKSKELARIEDGEAQTERQLKLTLPTASEGFKDGKSIISVDASDAGIWANSATTTKEILVDSKFPRIEVLSQQHVVAQGGSELVLLRVRDENLSRVSVTVQGIDFPAFPLKDLDPEFDAATDLYGVLFALPMGFDPTRDKVEALATDAAGNVRKVIIAFRVAMARQIDVNPKLTREFLLTNLPDLLASYGRWSKGVVPDQVTIEQADDQTLIGYFKMINESFRALLQDKLKELLSGKISARAWQGDFVKPMSSATTSVFGERRGYTLQGVSAGGSIHYGLDLASFANDIVKATNSGTVVFAGEFGIYGETVIVDHGLGLSSLYGHLSSISVQVGESIVAGAELGRSGKTGLAGGDHLHFEFRVNNIPATPIEWWDPKWVRDHVTGKVAGLKAALKAQSELAASK